MIQPQPSEPSGPPSPAHPPAGGAGKGLLRATFVLTVVLALFFSPALLTRNQFTFRDTGRLHHPQKSFLAEEFRQGRVPQWNPYMGMGVPIVSTAVDAPLHPFNLLLAFLPFEVGFKAWILLSYLLGGTGAFLLARRLGLSHAPALGCSLAFGLSGFLVSSSDNVTYLTAAASIPWVLVAGEDWYRRGGPLRLGLLGAASLLCAAAGDPQTWGIAVGILGLRGLWIALAGPARVLPLRRALLAGLAAAVAAAPLLVPVVLWAPLSRRAEGLEAFTQQRWNLHPVRLLEFFLPSIHESKTWGTLSGDVFGAYFGTPGTSVPWVASIYVGVSTLALAVLGAWYTRKARVLVAASVVLTWAAMGHWAGFVAVVRHVPVIGHFRYWEKLTAWPSLLLAVAAGIGLEVLLADRDHARRFARAVGAAALLFLCCWGAARSLPLSAWLARPGVSPDLVGQLVHNLQRATGITALVLSLLAAASFARGLGLLARAAPLAFVCIVAFDVASANVRAYLLAPPETVKPGPVLTRWLQERPELPRVVTPYDLGKPSFPGLSPFQATWRWGAHNYVHAWHVGARIANFDVYTALNPRRLTRFRLNAGLDKLVPQVGLWGFRYLVVPGMPSNARFMHLAPPYDVQAADPENKIFLVQFAHRPRVYLAEEVVSVDAAGALAFAYDPRSTASARSVIEAPLPPITGSGPPGDARIVQSSTDEVVIEVEARRPALLVLNDQDAPGWSARVDGEERPIVTANYLARGVWVEPGAHRVVFRFSTPGLAAGSAAALVGALALVAWAILRRRRPLAPQAPGGGSSA